MESQAMTTPSPRVQLPVQRPGISPVCLSPNAFAERSVLEARKTPSDARDPKFWFAVSDQRDVQNDGVHFGGRVYWSDVLIPYVSTGSRAQKPRFQVRYDAAEFAAGHLEEIVLYVYQEATARWQEVGSCRESTMVAFELSNGQRSSDATLRARAAYEAHLVEQRDAQNDAVMTLKAGAETATREKKMRQRRATGTRTVAPAAPRPAAPLFADASDAERANQAFLADFASTLERTADASDRGGESLPPEPGPGGTAEHR